MRKLKDELVDLLSNLPFSIGTVVFGMRPQTDNGDGAVVNIESMFVNRYQGFRKYTTTFKVALFADSNYTLSTRADQIRYDLHRQTINGVMYYVESAEQAYDEKDNAVRIVTITATYIDISEVTNSLYSGFFPTFPTMPVSLANVPWYSYPETNTSGYGAWISPLLPDRIVAFRDISSAGFVYSQDIVSLDFVGIKYRTSLEGPQKDIQMPELETTYIAGREFKYYGTNFNSAVLKYGIDPTDNSGVMFTMDFDSWPAEFFEEGSVPTMTELEVQFYITTTDGLRVYHALRAPTYYQ